VLREALGAEVLAHLAVAARPAVTEEMRELAEDVGDDRAAAHFREGGEAMLVGRFSPRTRVAAGDRVEIAVDPEALQFFDPQTGLAISTR
jgi:multiple sugar transport system ATP-binding protein